MEKRRRLTHGDHALQTDDVGMIKLAHDARLAQKIPPLLLGKPSLQRLNGHTHLTLRRELQTTAANLAILAYTYTLGLSEYILISENYLNVNIFIYSKEKHVHLIL